MVVVYAPYRALPNAIMAAIDKTPTYQGELTISAQIADYEVILALVRSWPAAQRFTLVQDVIETLAPTEREPRRTLEQARGLLATKQSGHNVARWLDERRTERYGL